MLGLIGGIFRYEIGIDNGMWFVYDRKWIESYVYSLWGDYRFFDWF